MVRECDFEYGVQGVLTIDEPAFNMTRFSLKHVLLTTCPVAKEYILSQVFLCRFFEFFFFNNEFRFNYDTCTLCFKIVKGCEMISMQTWSQACGAVIALLENSSSYEATKAEIIRNALSRGGVYKKFIGVNYNSNRMISYRMINDQ